MSQQVSKTADYELGCNGQSENVVEEIFPDLRPNFS
jgi:hypothetical protein